MDPKEPEVLKVMGHKNPQVLYWNTRLPVPDLVHVLLQERKVSEVWRVPQGLKVRKEKMASVQRPVRPAMHPQEHLVCLVLQDPEVSLVHLDNKAQGGLRGTQVTWVTLVLQDL